MHKKICWLQSSLEIQDSLTHSKIDSNNQDYFNFYTNFINCKYTFIQTFGPPADTIFCAHLHLGHFVMLLSSNNDDWCWGQHFPNPWSATKIWTFY